MYGESESRSSRVTIKRLTIPNLSRDYQNKRLSCHASNTHLVSPAMKYITLDINRKYAIIILSLASCVTRQGLRHPELPPEIFPSTFDVSISTK